MSTAAIRFEQVSRHFGEVKAVDRVDLEIHDGEFFSMLGPSGSGKTTCLRMIAGFDRPTAGRIFLYGQDVSFLPPYERDVNTVFQDYALFPHMTVADNIAYGLMVKKVGKAERMQRVEEMLDLVQLSGFGGRKPSQLSGGQRQRVALARAFVNHPKVLLLDEPLGALDLKLRQQMQVELKAIQKRVGITFIFVTHDQEEALTMSDRIAVMSKGKVQQLATPVEIYERPVNKFVADFIGESNFLDGKIKSISKDEAVVHVPALNTEIRGMPMTNDMVNGEEVAVSIRPEKIRIVENNSKGEGLFNAKVTTSVYIGSDTHVYVDLNGIRLKVMEQNRISRLDPSSFYSKDQVITLLFMPENTLVLKKD